MCRKSSVADLALFGGRPEFPSALHVGSPNIGGHAQFFARVADILDRRRLTNDGPYVRAFERALEAYTGATHVIAMANGTLSLELALRALDLRGDVLVPSFTFIANPHVLRWQGLRPVFCDIDPDTHGIDIAHAERRVTSRTSAILATHMWGAMDGVTELSRFAKRRGLRVVCDAAHAFGSSAPDGRLAGNFGDAEVFSFHATKILNSFEGGAVATGSDALAARLRRMRNFGFAGDDEVDGLGTNAKMSEIAAAMGLSNLEHVDPWIERNREQYAQYRDLLRAVRGVRWFEAEGADRRNCQYVVVLIDAAAPLARDEIVRLLHAENVLVRRYFSPGCHRMHPYCDDPDTAVDLPVTDEIARQVLVLPTGSALSAADIPRVVGLLAFLLTHAAEVRRSLTQLSLASPTLPAVVPPA